ncbi:MAG: DUF1059 domain-containing protein [Cellvibrionaceae bacterium]
MKVMSCKQLGGACDLKFSAETFEEMAEKSKLHGMDMFQKQDALHLKAMQDMQKLMGNPEKMQQWFESKRREFDELPNSENDQ